MVTNTKLEKMEPYYQSPTEEVPRIARIREGVKKYVKNLDNVLFMAMKSWNDNIVIYEYDGNSSVNCSWLSLEPEDVERHSKSGNPSLRSRLNPAENEMFGCDVSVVEGDRFIIKMKQPQLSHKTFELVMDSLGKPAVIGQINGVMCRVDYAYVQMQKGFIPAADYMNFCGRSLENNKNVIEKING